MKVNIGPYTKTRERQISVQIEKFDTWNMDHTLALIILPLLIQYKETLHSYPTKSMTSYSSSQHSFPFYAGGDDMAADVAFQEWKDILDKMIWSFTQLVDGNEGYDLVKNINGERDYSAMQEFESKMKDGFLLFGQYYQALWD